MNMATRNDDLTALLDSLTIVGAREYAAQTDKLIWIETVLLDPLDIPRKYATTVEAHLVDLLARRCWLAPKWDERESQYVVRCYKLSPRGELTRFTDGDYFSTWMDDAVVTFNAMMDQEAARHAAYV